MDVFYLPAGILIFTITIVDIIKTTLSTKGGGVITKRTSKAVWKLFFSLSGKEGKSSFLEYAGTAVLVVVLLVWIIGLWSSLFLLLLSDGDSIISSTTRESATALEKLYYAGFTLSTLGVGDFVASSSSWRILTSSMAFAGLVFITTSITYFLPVLSAVNLQSKLSLYISSMGGTPQEMVAKGWNGENFSSFFDCVPNMCQMLIKHTLNHHSYPVIHYFHNKEPKQAIIVQVVVLEEVYYLLRQVVSTEVILDEVKMTMLRTALDTYFSLVKENFIKEESSHKSPPAPELAPLLHSGIPVKQEASINQGNSQQQPDSRNILTALLGSDGWTWQEVYPTKDIIG
ncbi:two pore domain potassium channel family protein [Rufibacter immobilis]|uniref:Two pore domain potassium channel family protein n=1 Tax=Rufibacter immobilis TaxID=1348778 RepID=A0A3M9N1Z9_9BACT|nr:potassium channel family protein [Rufibacter immobilis]RNI31822.1 two pore domain potassium channel family protein [Rufibacter immobilis]